MKMRWLALIIAVILAVSIIAYIYASYYLSYKVLLSTKENQLVPFPGIGWCTCLCPSGAMGTEGCSGDSLCSDESCNCIMPGPNPNSLPYIFPQIGGFFQYEIESTCTVNTCPSEDKNPEPISCEGACGPDAPSNAYDCCLSGYCGCCLGNQNQPPASLPKEEI